MSLPVLKRASLAGPEGEPSNKRQQQQAGDEGGAVAPERSLLPPTPPISR